MVLRECSELTAMSIVAASQSAACPSRSWRHLEDLTPLHGELETSSRDFR